MMKPPIIGITTYPRSDDNEFVLPASYIDAIRLAGGIPILMTPGESQVESLLTAIDGLVLAGGGDINPELYQGQHHPAVYNVNPERDEFELALAQRALVLKLPILGICRGMQILTVATGGSLTPHVPDAYDGTVLHRYDNPRRPTDHEVTLRPDSQLAAIMQATELSIVSWHHQAVEEVPHEWQVVAYAADGLVEAIEHQRHPWAIAVQWHPEMSSLESIHSRLFQAFVQAASQPITVMQRAYAS